MSKKSNKNKTGIGVRKKNQFEYQKKAIRLAAETNPELQTITFLKQGTGMGKSQCAIDMQKKLPGKKDKVNFLTTQQGLTREQYYHYKHCYDNSICAYDSKVQYRYDNRGGDSSEHIDEIIDPLDSVYKSGKIETHINAENCQALFSTIDFLIPASDGTRGKKGISQRYRLRVSDTIIDEPDALDLKDFPSLLGFIKKNGECGGNLFIASATSTETLDLAIAEAFLAGVKDREYGSKGVNVIIVHESGSHSGHCSGIRDFQKLYKKFGDSLRRYNLNNLERVNPKFSKVEKGPISEIAKTVLGEAIELHNINCLTEDVGGNKKNISIGLARLAHIKTLIEMVKYFENNGDIDIIIIPYHSRFPSIKKKQMESLFSSVLSRKGDNRSIWGKNEIIDGYIEGSKSNNIIFIVFSTTIVERGRDYDFDWAISEYISFASSNQVAGRVRRHNYEPYDKVNHIIITSRILALTGQCKGDKPIFCTPGLEVADDPVPNHDIRDLNDQDDFRQANLHEYMLKSSLAKGVIKWEKNTEEKFLNGERESPRVPVIEFIRYPYSHTSIRQRVFPFRKGEPSYTYSIIPLENQAGYNIDVLSKNGSSTSWVSQNSNFNFVNDIYTNNGIQILKLPTLTELVIKSVQKDESVVDFCRKECRVSLPDRSGWYYSEIFGFYYE